MLFRSLALAVTLVALVAPTSAEPHRELPIDVAGHLTLAAHRGRPVVDGWDGGVVPAGIAVGEDGTLYWAQYRTDSIEAARPSGARLPRVATLDGPLGVAVDTVQRSLFYVTDRHFPRTVGSVRLDGSPGNVLVAGDLVNRPFGIAFATSLNKLIWSESINGRIRSADTGGGSLMTVFDDGIANFEERSGVVASSPLGVAVDEKRGFVFWSDIRLGTITRARLDGSARRVILSREHGLDMPTALALHPGEAKLYWADPGSESINRADLTGLYPEQVASSEDGVMEPYGLAIDPRRGLIYWTDIARDAIHRKPIGEGPPEMFIALGKRVPSGDSCAARRERAGMTFLRRWHKAIRTCVVSVTASKAVMRAPADLRAAAGTCWRQLTWAGAAETAYSPPCPEVFDDWGRANALALGARVIAEDLPRAAEYLRAVRPFVAGHRVVGEPVGPDAVEALDRIVNLLSADAARPGRVGKIPVSGQTTRYAARVLDGGATTVAVPDDGTQQVGAPLAYQDNGDGTITDLNTGLMWEKKCDGCQGPHAVRLRLPRYAAGGAMDAERWIDEVRAEDGTGFAGYGDWRLPEAAELLSLVHYERFNPAVDDAFFGAGCGLDCGTPTDEHCSCSALGAYWTAGADRQAAVHPTVSFHLGLVVGVASGDDAYVRAVRGRMAIPDDRYVDNGDGTISDRYSGLMWEKKCSGCGGLHDVERTAYWTYDGAEETVWDWIDAVNKEAGEGLAGYSDWRLPNVKELYSLRRAGGNEPFVDPAFQQSECAERSRAECSVTAPGLYWSSTTFADFPSLAVAVGFGPPARLERDPPPGVLRVAGGVEPHEKTLRRYMRAVRGRGE